ncbi:unnamed protein product [Rotaria sp. Silwood1]|nr:unnamed protein product [Rotaria sp. Silwood1]CAF4747751.1 unnamed protein product [Rotaria sp. Silwood1]
MYRLRYICRLIRPDSVISLKLSDDVKTPKQIEYFLSLINIRRFTQLHSLTITQDSEDLFSSIFDHVINCHSFVSFSIYFRPSPPFKHPDFRDYDLTGPTLGPLASVIAQSNLTIFKTNLRSYQLDKILSPIQYSFQHLTIGNCTRKQYYMILRHSPHLQTIVMEHFKRKQNQAIHDSESEENDQFVYDFYHPLTSLTLLEHQGSIFDLEKSLSLTPTLMHLKIIGDISDTIFFMDSSRLEEFIRSKLCSLKHFEIFINGSTNSENLSIDMLIEQFRTSFWIEEKHWFFTCEFLLRLQKFIFYSTPIPTINANYYFGFEKISTSTFDKPNMHTQMMNGVRHLHFSLWDMTYFNFQESLKTISMHTFTKIIRLFIDGVVDDASASIVDVRARSIGEVIGCQVSSSGLCTIQVTPNTSMTDIELRLIKQLTYRAMFVFDAEAPHITRIEILLTGVHRLNHHYVSDRLYQGIQGLVSCRFMDIDDSDDSHIELKYDSRNLSRFELLSIMHSLGYSAQIDSNETSLKAGIVVVQIRIEGMHCNSCVSNICATIEDLPGTIDIKLTFEEKIATVTYDSRILSLAHIVTEIEKLGFKAAVSTDHYEIEPSSSSELNNRNELTRKLPAITKKSDGIETCFIQVEGMTCTSCVDSIERNLSKVEGIHSVLVALLAQRAEVKYDPEYLLPSQIAGLIKDLGFRAQVLEITTSGTDIIDVNIDGMTCASCVSKIERHIKALSGIKSVDIALLTHRGRIKYDASSIGPRDIITQISDLGFPATLLSDDYKSDDIAKIQKQTTKKWRNAFILSTVFGIPAMVAMFLFMFKWQDHDKAPQIRNGLSLENVVMFCLATPVQGKTSEALKKLLSLQPLQGVLVKLDDRGKIIEEQVILAQLIQRGDLLKVVPGETIPTDGRIVDGTTTCDESLITGESMPVDKVVGAQVVGGTKNLVGSIIMQATHVGQETALKQIIKLVEDAQTSKAPIQELADKVAGVFVPFILIISFITWLIYVIIGYTAYDSLKKHSSYSESNMTHYSQSEIVFELAFRYGITVLSVACPCALGLATPTAVMVATGVGAASGILIKGGEPLELARKVRTIVFDKTGTITKGKPSVVDKQIFIDDDHLTLDRMLAIAATAESGSEHPLALAIQNECKQRFGTEQMGQCFDFKATWGYGLFARVTGIDCLIPQSDALRSYTVLIGNREWMMRNNINVNEHVDITMSKHEHDGHTAVLVAIDDILVGMFAIADEIKPSAPLTIFALNSLGLHTILLTGDNIKTARAIAAKVGIKTVYAEVLPTQKERFINKLKEKMDPEEKVAMVGDGINDSPALARADVGIAVGSGTDVAVEAASIVLIRDELFDVVTAIILSKKTIWRIWINFIFAIGYNVIAIPIAAGVLVPANIHLKPWMASAAMALSSISVVLSSLLLRYFRKPQIRTYENSSFQQWCTTMSADIEVHRGIEKVVGNSCHTSPASSRSGTSSKLSQLLIDAVSTFVKQSFGDKNKSKPVTTMDDTIGLTIFKA